MAENSKFQRNVTESINYQPDSQEAMVNNIVTIPVPKTHVIEKFSPQAMKGKAQLNYVRMQNTNHKITDKKNQRFRMSEHVKTALSVTAEDEKRIETEVERRLEEKFSLYEDDVKKNAYEIGFKTGLEEGKKTMADDAKPVYERLVKSVEHFEKLKHEVFLANEDYLIKLVYRIAKMVALKEIKEDAAYVKKLVIQLLERLGTRENIKVFVSEQAFSASAELKASLAETFGQLKNISIELDSSIQDEGCRVETDFAEVDARIEVQLHNIASAMGVEQA